MSIFVTGTRQVLVDIYAANGPLLFTYPMQGKLDDFGFKRLGRSVQ